VACVGCAVFLYDYIDVDVVEAPHGARARGGHRRQARAAGQVRLHLPGGRRSRGDRYIGGHPCGEPGENLTVVFVNKHHLRNDRWPDGAYYDARAEDLHHTVRTGFPRRRLSDQDGGTPRRPRGDRLLRPGRRIDPAQIRKAKEAVRKAFEMQIHGMGFSIVSSSRLPDELGDEAAGRPETGARGDVGIFSARGLQGTEAGGRRMTRDIIMAGFGGQGS